MARAIVNSALSRRAVIALAGSLMLAMAAGTAWAHHGWSEYDTGKRATLTGTIRELHFSNPHATLLLETAGQTWSVMLDSPARLQNRGVTAGMLEVGRSITIEGLPHKSRENEFRAERIVLDGKTIELR
jgi:hypothetical protein